MVVVEEPNLYQITIDGKRTIFQIIVMMNLKTKI